MCIIKHNETNFNSFILEKVEIIVLFQVAIHGLLSFYLLLISLSLFNHWNRLENFNNSA